MPEPFGPMIACTSPAFTARSMPLRIFLPSTFDVEVLDFKHCRRSPSSTRPDRWRLRPMYLKVAALIAALDAGDDADCVGVRILDDVDLRLWWRARDSEALAAGIDDLMRLGAGRRSDHVAGADR